MNFSANQVTIQAGYSLARTGSDDASGTLQIHKNDFSMYNVNVKNTYGKGSQAIVLSQYGSRVGLYACRFHGYQDTILAEQGTQVYLRNYIEVRIIRTHSAKEVSQDMLCLGRHRLYFRAPGPGLLRRQHDRRMRCWMHNCKRTSI
jgi:pectin methylesterase-like acyl-CoA thioesterase